MGYWGHSRQHDAAWRWLLEEQCPDIALLQECKPPSWANERAQVLFERAFPESRRQQWGTALVTNGLPTERVFLTEVEDWFAQLGPDAPKESGATRLRSWCVSASVELPAIGPVVVLSVHNPFFPIVQKFLEGVDVSEIKLKHQRSKVWLLDVLFYFLKGRLDRPLVVGGDFNYSRLLDEPRPRGNNEFFDRIQEEGFVSLHRKFHAGDEQTFFDPKKRLHQLDYLYADSSIAGRVTACYVVKYDKVRNFSDHAPLVAEIDA
jgi:exonuclease III